MTYRTHLIGGAQTGILLAHVYGGKPAETVVIIGTTMLGSIIPDVDWKESRIARGDWLMTALSMFISRFTHHRGLLHTIPGALIFAAIFYGLSLYNNAIESLYALLASITVFIAFHLMSRQTRRLGLAAASAAFIGTPFMIDMLRGVDVTFDPEPHMSLLCAVSVFAGCIVHMLYDTFNKGGISWLYPISRKRISVADIKTRTAGEFYFTFLMTVILTGEVLVVCRNMKAAYMIRELITDVSVIASEMVDMVFWG